VRLQSFIFKKGRFSIFLCALAKQALLQFLLNALACANCKSACVTLAYGVN